MATGYTGPSAREMIESHTLAKEIIARHDRGPEAVLDATELARLKRFVTDPSSKEEILKELDMEDQAGDRPGTNAHRKGSLVGFVIASSAAGDEILNDEEMSLLRTWFAQS